MFARRPHQNDSFSKHRASKSVSISKSVSVNKQKRSFRDHATSSKRTERPIKPAKPESPNLTSPIITLAIGPSARLFAAHADILSSSSFFAAIIRGQFLESSTKRVALPEEIPEVFSSVLEYLYKGDYFPTLLLNKRRNTWELEQTPAGYEGTIWSDMAGQSLLKDTLIYCAAERYGLDDLKRLALRKQGLQSGVSCATILASARFAYGNTPDNDSKLRAHYLALIIRSRATFKRSGTMQMEMEAGGLLFFDLFVAMCNHIDDISAITKSPHTPRSDRTR